MKQNFVFLCLLAIIFVSCSHQGNRKIGSIDGHDDLIERGGKSATKFPTYYLTDNFVLPVEVFESALDPNDDNEIAPDGLEIMLKRGTPFRVTQEAVDENETFYIKLQIGDERFPGSINVWVTKESFAQLFEQKEELVKNYFDSNRSYSAMADILNFEPYGVAGIEFFPPIKARLTSKPGMRRHPILKKKKFHAGWDYGAPTGTAVKAAAKGTVIHAGKAGGYGNLIKLDHAEGYETRYAHLSKILVKLKQKVEAQQHIGNVGSTGRSTGPHLHFEKRLNGKPLTN